MNRLTRWFRGQKLRTNTPFLFAALMSLLFGLAEAKFFLSTVGQVLEDVVLRSFYVMRGPVDAPEEIVIVGFSDECQKQLGFSWSRSPRVPLARVFKRLQSDGARGAVLDILLSSPRSEEIDNPLAEAIAGLPTALLSPDISDQAASPVDRGPQVRERPIVLFARSARTVLPSNLLVEGWNQIVKRFWTFGGRTTMAEALTAFGYSPAKVPGATALLKYYGEKKPIATVPFHKIVSGRIPAGFFKDKIAFIGDIRSGAKDTFTSSYGTTVYGVEIHATAAANILEQSWIEGCPLMAAVVIFPLAVLLFSFAAMYLRPAVGVSLAAASAVVSLLGSYALFTANLYLPAAAFSLVMLAAAVFGFIFSTLTMRRAIEIAGAGSVRSGTTYIRRLGTASIGTLGRMLRRE